MRSPSSKRLSIVGRARAAACVHKSACRARPLAEPCPAAEACRSGRRDAARPARSCNGWPGRQDTAAPDGLVAGRAGNPWLAGRPRAGRRPWRCRWIHARTGRQRIPIRFGRRGAGLAPAGGRAAPQARCGGTGEVMAPRPAGARCGRLAAAARTCAGAAGRWSAGGLARPGSAQESARRNAGGSVAGFGMTGAGAGAQSLLRRRSQEARRAAGSATQERADAESQEAPEAAAAAAGLARGSRGGVLRNFFRYCFWLRPRLRLRPDRENARALFPRRQHRWNWSASFFSVTPASGR